MVERYFVCKPNWNLQIFSKRGYDFQNYQKVNENAGIFSNKLTYKTIITKLFTLNDFIQFWSTLYESYAALRYYWCSLSHFWLTNSHTRKFSCIFEQKLWFKTKGFFYSLLSFGGYAIHLFSMLLWLESSRVSWQTLLIYNFDTVFFVLHESMSFT